MDVRSNRNQLSIYPLFRLIWNLHYLPVGFCQSLVAAVVLVSAVGFWAHYNVVILT